MIATLTLTYDQIERLVISAPPTMRSLLGDVPVIRRYVERRAADEREHSALAVLMACYMPHADALRYADEARVCVGLGRAYDAACAGRPFMLPWRGPEKETP